MEFLIHLFIYQFFNSFNKSDPIINRNYLNGSLFYNYKSKWYVGIDYLLIISSSFT